MQLMKFISLFHYNKFHIKLLSYVTLLYVYTHTHAHTLRTTHKTHPSNLEIFFVLIDYKMKMSRHMLDKRASPEAVVLNTSDKKAITFM